MEKYSKLFDVSFGQISERVDSVHNSLETLMSKCRLKNPIISKATIKHQSSMMRAFNEILRKEKANRKRSTITENSINPLCRKRNQSLRIFRLLGMNKSYRVVSLKEHIKIPSSSYNSAFTKPQLLNITQVNWNIPSNGKTKNTYKEIMQYPIFKRNTLTEDKKMIRLRKCPKEALKVSNKYKLRDNKAPQMISLPDTSPLHKHKYLLSNNNRMAVKYNEMLRECANSLRESKELCESIRSTRNLINNEMNTLRDSFTKPKNKLWHKFGLRNDLFLNKTVKPQ